MSVEIPRISRDRLATTALGLGVGGAAIHLIIETRRSQLERRRSEQAISRRNDRRGSVNEDGNFDFITPEARSA